MSIVFSKDFLQHNRLGQLAHHIIWGCTAHAGDPVPGVSHHCRLNRKSKGGEQWVNKPSWSLEPLAPLGLRLPDNCVKMAIMCGFWCVIRHEQPPNLAPASSTSREVSRSVKR